MKLAIKFLLALFLSNFQCQALEVCTSEWDMIIGRETVTGIDTAIKSHVECLNSCEFDAECLGVDFHHFAPFSCRVHKDAGFEQRSTANNQTAQYVIKQRTCVNVSQEDTKCPSSWTLYNHHEIDYVESTTNHVTLHSCLNACRFNKSCIAIVFNLKFWPMCYMYAKETLREPLPLKVNEGTETYLFDYTCEEDDKQTVGRCVGTEFPLPNQWCKDGEVKLENSAFKISPHCCAGEFDNVPPLDSKNMTLFSTQLLKEYNEEIKTCVSNGSCVLTAKPYKQSFVDNIHCAAEKTSTNYVSLEYSCVSKNINQLSTSVAPTPIESHSPFTATITTTTTSTTTTTTTTTARLREQTPPLAGTTKLLTNITVATPTTAGPDLVTPTTATPDLATTAIFNLETANVITPTSNEVIYPGTNELSTTTTTALKIVTTTYFMNFTMPATLLVNPTISSPAFSTISNITAASNIFTATPIVTVTTKITPNGNVDQAKSGEVKSSESHAALVLGAIGTTLGLLCLIALLLILGLVVYNTKKQSYSMDSKDLVIKNHMPNENYIGISSV